MKILYLYVKLSFLSKFENLLKFEQLLELIMLYILLINNYPFISIESIPTYVRLIRFTFSPFLLEIN